ncbi:MAG: DUF1573 domain-containing protein [Steroidobacteraceae bacterium]
MNMQSAPLWAIGLSILLGTLSADAQDGKEYPVYEFGELAQGVIAAHEFELQNQGNQTVEVARVDFSLAGVTAGITRFIEPGTVAKLRLKWDTSTYVGPWEGTMTVRFSSPGHAPMTFGFSGTVRAPIEFSPFPAFYISQFAGESATRSIELNVNQERDVTIKSVRIPPGLGSLSVDSLTPGRHYRLTVTAAPTLPVGLHSDFGYLMTDDADQSELRVQLNIKVKADLHPSAESVELGRLRPAVLRANPEMLEFITGSVTVESRYGKASKLAATVDLDFLEVVAEAGDDDRRLGIELRPKLDQLKPGSYTGTLTVGFAETPETTLRLPVTVVVEG